MKDLLATLKKTTHITIDDDLSPLDNKPQIKHDRPLTTKEVSILLKQFEVFAKNFPPIAGKRVKIKYPSRELKKLLECKGKPATTEGLAHTYTHINEYLKTKETVREGYSYRVVRQKIECHLYFQLWYVKYER